MPDVYLGLSLDVYLTLKLVYPGSCRPKQLILGRLLEKTIPWPILAQWRPSSVIHSRKALKNGEPRPVLVKSLFRNITNHPSHTEFRGSTRLMQWTSYLQILTQQSILSWPKICHFEPSNLFLRTPPRTTPALKDLQKMLPLTKKGIPFRSQNKTSKKKKKCRDKILQIDKIFVKKLHDQCFEAQKFTKNV